MKNLKISLALFILVLLFVMPNTNGLSNKRAVAYTGVNRVKSDSPGYSVSFPDANILWSYPISGSHPEISMSGFFSLQGSGGIVGGNITGDGSADFLLLYYNSINKNATTSVVDGGNGRLIWEDNFSNFITYYMEGTLGTIPLICVLTGNVTYYSSTGPYGSGEPIYGPGYLSINMVNGLNGSVMWVANNYLKSSSNGIFFTTNNTIFASTNPVITTYAIFTITKTQYNVLNVYDITLVGIKNINGNVTFRHSYSTLSSNIYYSPYLSIDKIPGLPEGGIFYTYILNSSGNLTSRIVLISSTGQVIWNITSNNDILILTSGTENAVSIAVGNFTGGLYYDLAFTFVSVSKTLAYNFGVEVVNITDGNIVYMNQYSLYEDPGVGQFIGSTPFLESELNIDNATGGYGQLLRIKSSIPLLIITLYSRTGNGVENVLAINILQNQTVWNTTLKHVGPYGAATPFYYKNNPYVLIITNDTQFIVLNGTNGRICSYTLPSQINDPDLILSMLSNSKSYSYNYDYAPSLSSYLNVSASSSSLQYNVTLSNIFTNTTIAKNEIKPFKNNNTPSSELTFILNSYMGFKSYITASIDANYSGHWIDSMYIMSDSNLSVAWKYTAQSVYGDPFLVSTPSWNFYRILYPEYGSLSKNPYNLIFPVQTTYRFYMLEFNNSGAIVSSIHSTTDKGYAPLHDTFYVIVNGGLPSYYYKWYINGTYSGSTSSNFSTVFYSSGIYNISVIVTDQLNHTAYAFNTVTVYLSNKTVNKTSDFIVSGSVVYYNGTTFGTPLSNVSIYVNTTFYGYTDVNGTFSISLPNDTYILNFSKKGYYSYTKNITIKGYNINHLSIVLSAVKSSTPPTTTTTPSSNNGNSVKIYILIAILTALIVSIVLFLSYPWIKKKKKV